MAIRFEGQKPADILSIFAKQSEDDGDLAEKRGGPSLAERQNQGKAIIDSTPRTTGGSVSNVTESNGIRMKEVAAPYTSDKYYSRRMDESSNWGMGGNKAYLSEDEFPLSFRSLPVKGAVVGALDAIESIAKAPASMLAGHYANKDTYTSKREEEGGASVQSVRDARSEQYQKENKEKNDQKAKKFADLADKVNLYGNDTSVRNFMNDTQESMQAIKDAYKAVGGAENTFTLADMTYTVGQMAPSIAMGNVGGAVAGAVGQTVGSIGTMYASVYGRSFDEAMQATGGDIKTAADYAASHAMVEAGTELLGGGIPGMNEGLATKFISNMAEKTAQKLGGKATASFLPKALGATARFLSSDAGEMVLDILGEGVEEMIAEAYDPVISNATIDPKDPNASWSDLIDWENIALAGFMGATMSLVMQGGVAALKTGYSAYDAAKKARLAKDVETVETAEATGATSAPVTDYVIEEAAEQTKARETSAKKTTKRSVVETPASSVEAAKNGALSTSEAEDLNARRAARTYVNALLEYTEYGIREFSEGGSMYGRYKDTITPEMLKNYKGDFSSIPRFLDENADYTWDEIDKYVNEVAVPYVSAATVSRENYDGLAGRVRVQTDTQDVMMNAKEYLDLFAQKVFGVNSYTDLDGADKALLRRQFQTDAAKGAQEVQEYVNSTNKRLENTGMKMELDESLDASEGMRYDADTKTIRVNPNAVLTADVANYLKGHELVHMALGTLDESGRRSFRRYTREAAKAIGVDLNDWVSEYKSREEYKGRANEEAYARFYQNLFGSTDMLESLAKNSHDTLSDIIGYLKAVAKSRPQTSKVARAVDASVIAEAQEVAQGKGTKRRAKREKAVVKNIPEEVVQAAAVPSTDGNTVEEAKAAAVETAPSTTAEEAKAKATAAEAEKTEAKNPKAKKTKAEKTEEVFAPKSESVPEISAEAKQEGFQRVPSTSKNQYTLQEAVAGKGKSSREKRMRAAEAKQLEAIENTTTILMPGMNGVSLTIVETNAKGKPVRTIRAVPDDNHRSAKRGDYNLLHDFERKQLKQLGFKDAGYGVYEHDFTPEFWNSVRTADVEAIRAHAGTADDREPFREYTSSIQPIRDTGAVFCFVPGKDGEQIKMYFRRADGSRVYGTTITVETLKKYGFEYSKDNPNGKGFYAPYSDKLASDLGLPATTKLMRERENTLLNVKRRMFKNETVPCTGEGYVGFDLGYDPRTQTLYLYKDGVPVYSAPYSNEIVDKAIGRTTILEDTFMAKSDAKKRIDEIVDAVKNRPREFPGITADEEALRNKRAEAQRAFKPLPEEEAKRVANLEKKDSRKKNMVRVEFRDTDESVVLPISTLKQMTTLSSGKKMGLSLSFNGQMLDQLYWGAEDEAVRTDPRTGEQRRLTGHEIPSKIVDLETGKTVWDATKYDETKSVPGEDIKFDEKWFENAFARATDLVSEMDKEIKESRAREKEEEIFKKKSEQEAEAYDAAELGRSYTESEGLADEAASYVAESSMTEDEYYEQMARDVEDAENGTRRGWANNDAMFAEKQSVRKLSDAEKLWDERRKAAKLSMSEAASLKEAERASARSVDLSSMTAQELMNIYDSSAKHAKLVKALTEQRDTARSEGRFDDYAVLDQRLNEVNALIADYNKRNAFEPKEKKLTKQEKAKRKERLAKLAEQEEFESFPAPEYDEGYYGEDAVAGEVIDTRPPQQRMYDSDGYLLSPIQEEFYQTKPGSWNDDGQVQKYYTDYMDADNTEFGNGIIRLYKDPTDTNYQVEEVYAATERPVYYDDTVSESILSAELVQDVMEQLGLAYDAASVAIDENANLLETLRAIAAEAETEEVSAAAIMDELLLQLGADCVILPDGMVLFDERYIKSAKDKNPARSSSVQYMKMDDAYFEELRRQWGVAQDKYGTIEGTDIPTRVSDDGKKVTTTMRQLTQNENFNVEGTPLDDATRAAILNGMVSYAPMTDKKALKLVGDWLKRGSKGTADNPNEMSAEDFRRKFDSWMDSGSVTDKVSVLKGGQLMSEMANFAREHPDQVSNQMCLDWERLVGKMGVGASKTGQALQAFGALKKLTPQGRLWYIEAMVDQLQEDINHSKGVLRGKLKEVHFTIEQSLIDDLMDAKTPKELDKVEDKIAKHVAEQIPATAETRAIAWRYLCMLGSIRTHMRNLFSNAMMFVAKSTPVIGARDLSGITQDIAGLVNPDMEKTVSFVKRGWSKEIREFTKQQAEVQKEALQYGGKQGFQDKISNYRRNFGKSIAGRFFEALSRINGNALEFEDLVFLNLEYRQALRRYMAANNFTPEYFRSNTRAALEDLNKANEYSLNAAWEATYRKANIVADALNTIEKKSAAGALIVGGIAPFKRTPMNIPIQGMKYSPLGLVNATAKMFDKLRTGETTGAEVADALGQGLTGTGIMVLGYWLGTMGLMKASGSDNDKEESYDQMLGNQRYSINFSGKNYTIDWLTPISMPLMAGVELAEHFKREAETDEEEDFGMKFNRVVSALSTMADPVTNLSMLQSVNDALNTYGDDQVGGLISSAVQSYALQFVPTASGQMLRTTDPTRRVTYAPSDSHYPFGKTGEQFVNKLKNKSLIANHFLGDNNEYVDLWGRTEQGEENVALRAFNQFVAPWYSRDFNRTAVDDRLADIFAKNGGDRVVLPKVPQSQMKINGETYYLSGDEYEQTKKTVGNLSYRGLEDAFAFGWFDGLDEAQQTYVCDKVYDYAWIAAKAAYAEEHGLTLSSTDASTADKIARAEAGGIGVGQYYAINSVVKDLKKAEKKERLAAFGVPESLWELW